MLAIGEVLRTAASPEHPADAYRRSQLLSAYSVSRHLAAEERAAAGLQAWTRARAAALLREASGRGMDDALVASLEQGASRLDTPGTRPEIGPVLADALARLRDDGSDSAATAADGLRHLLREICDREVAALAEPAQVPRSPVRR